ncbi:hypothetical protein PIB30_102007 [Stylosanthes scabra]|uniref:Uncharacterized protein n=1 Tax=Stylosanthes scabra TaxID=79078 RepID=A0ABU6YX82_9FABA|nr:hypothetical protein [Stylosanthes scabra]
MRGCCTPIRGKMIHGPVQGCGNVTMDASYAWTSTHMRRTDQKTSKDAHASDYEWEKCGEMHDARWDTEHGARLVKGLGRKGACPRGDRVGGGQGIWVSVCVLGLAREWERGMSHVETAFGVANVNGKGGAWFLGEGGRGRTAFKNGKGWGRKARLVTFDGARDWERNVTRGLEGSVLL